MLRRCVHWERNIVYATYHQIAILFYEEGLLQKFILRRILTKIEQALRFSHFYRLREVIMRHEDAITYDVGERLVDLLS